jgi:hypothetical protein
MLARALLLTLILLPFWVKKYGPKGWFHTIRLRVRNRIPALCFSKPNRDCDWLLISNHQSWLITNLLNYSDLFYLIEDFCPFGHICDQIAKQWDKCWVRLERQSRITICLTTISQNGSIGDQGTRNDRWYIAFERWSFSPENIIVASDWEQSDRQREGLGSKRIQGSMPVAMLRKAKSFINNDWKWSLDPEPYLSRLT